jgi:hypothetical protein
MGLLEMSDDEDEGLEDLKEDEFLVIEEDVIKEIA